MTKMKEEHKLTDKMFNELLDEMVAFDKKQKDKITELKAGIWVLIRKKIDQALKEGEKK